MIEHCTYSRKGFLFGHGLIPEDDTKPSTRRHGFPFAKDGDADDGDDVYGGGGDAEFDVHNNNNNNNERWNFVSRFESGEFGRNGKDEEDELETTEEILQGNRAYDVGDVVGVEIDTVQSTVHFLLNGEVQRMSLCNLPPHPKIMISFPASLIFSCISFQRFAVSEARKPQMARLNGVGSFFEREMRTKQYQEEISENQKEENFLERRSRKKGSFKKKSWQEMIEEVDERFEDGNAKGRIRRMLTMKEGSEGKEGLEAEWLEGWGGVEDREEKKDVPFLPFGQMAQWYYPENEESSRDSYFL